MHSLPASGSGSDGLEQDHEGEDMTEGFGGVLWVLSWIFYVVLAVVLVLALALAVYNREIVNLRSFLTSF